MSDRMDPKRIFFIKVPDGNTDGLIDLGLETPDVFESEKAAIAAAKDEAHDCCGGSFFILEVKPLYWVGKKKISVEKLIATLTPEAEK